MSGRKESSFSFLSNVAINFIFAFPLLPEKEIKTPSAEFVNVIDVIGPFIWRKNFFLSHAAVVALTAYQDEAL
jgi:hypothetical protein